MSSVSLPPDFLESARAILGERGCITEQRAIAPFLTDWRGRWTGHTPLLARPSSTREASEFLGLCAESGVTVTPQGGNTGLVCGGIPYGEVLLSLTRMDKIVRTDEVGDTITVEAGVVLASVQRAAELAERLFPLSLGSEGSATIGGLVATNAGGVGVLRYGMMRDLVLGLEVVLSDGSIWDGRRSLRKDNSGYDMKQVFIGSEGTLGVITGAVLKLFPRPREREVCWLAAASVEDVVELYGKLRQISVGSLSAFELIPVEVLSLVLRYKGGKDPCASALPLRVLLEVSSHGSGCMESVLSEGLGLFREAVVAGSELQARELWRLRELIPEAERLHGRALKHDIALPLSELGVFVERASRLVERLVPGAEVLYFGHVGDGNLHYNVVCPSGESSEEFLTGDGLAVSEALYDLVECLGGSISAEHGIGLLRRVSLLRHASAVEVGMMRDLKRVFDPRGLLNPGRIVEDRA